MKPLNFAILKHFTTVDKASVSDVMNALKSEYANFKAFNKKGVLNALMTAQANGLLEEAGFELGSDNELNIYFQATEDSAKTINRYLRD
ncbi:hypothetical protein [Neisseria sp. Ec49-e6-T10]|uniref:hypothetical protein n=1 Tax=Neisseria sp. Ec49-e6-T10 TaxID=3140744 RepID=UPI003EBEB073